jgi:hypothetical protein
MEEGAERRARQLWLAPRGNILEGREGERGGFRGPLWRRAEDIEGEEGPTEEMRGGEKEEDQEKRRRGDGRNGGRGDGRDRAGGGRSKRGMGEKREALRGPGGKKREGRESNYFIIYIIYI